MELEILVNLDTLIYVFFALAIFYLAIKKFDIVDLSLNFFGLKVNVKGKTHKK